MPTWDWRYLTHSRRKEDRSSSGSGDSTTNPLLWFQLFLPSNFFFLFSFLMFERLILTFWWNVLLLPLNTVFFLTRKKKLSFWRKAFLVTGGPICHHSPQSGRPKRVLFLRSSGCLKGPGAPPLHRWRFIVSTTRSRRCTVSSSGYHSLHLHDPNWPSNTTHTTSPACVHRKTAPLYLFRLNWSYEHNWNVIASWFIAYWRCRCTRLKSDNLPLKSKCPNFAEHWTTSYFGRYPMFCIWATQNHLNNNIKKNITVYWILFPVLFLGVLLINHTPLCCIV